MGVFLAFFSHVVIRKPLYRHVEKLMDGDYRAREGGYGAICKRFSILLVTSSMFSISIFLICNRKNELALHDEWRKTISLHCADQAGVDHL